jgi:hypothetical protein
MSWSLGNSKHNPQLQEPGGSLVMDDQHPEIGKHPRGTLALIGLYGLVFLLGWLAIFFFVYVPRGAVTR